MPKIFINFAQNFYMVMQKSAYNQHHSKHTTWQCSYTIVTNYLPNLTLEMYLNQSNVPMWEIPITCTAKRTQRSVHHRYVTKNNGTLVIVSSKLHFDIRSYLCCSAWKHKQTPTVPRTRCAKFPQNLLFSCNFLCFKFLIFLSWRYKSSIYVYFFA